MSRVVFPTMRKPPVVESWVTKKSRPVSAVIAVLLSSLFITAITSFIYFLLHIKFQKIETVFIERVYILYFIAIVV